MPDHLVLVFLFIAKFEIAFERLREGHLHGADHASPSIIALNFLNPLPVGEPEDVPINKQKLVCKIGIVAMAQQLRIRAIVSYLDFLALDERNYGDIGVLDGVDEVGLDFSDFGEGVVKGVVERGGELASPVKHGLGEVGQVVVDAVGEGLLLCFFHEQVNLIIIIGYACSIATWQLMKGKRLCS